MSPTLVWTLVFAVALAVSLGVQTWLGTRQMRHVARHRGALPEAFRATTSLAAHQRAADYTLAKGAFAQWRMVFGAVVLLGWTLFGGLDLLSSTLREAVAPRYGAVAYGLALLTAFAVVGGLLELPFELYATFGLEQRFGFNRMTWRLWLADTVKGLLLAAAIGLPLAAGVLWLMAKAGAAWWLWTWGAWMATSLAATVVVPTVIAPLFNRFVPLADEALQARVQALMARAGFASRGLFVMDGSRRSAHANAYFTGFGAAKRVVFFDTLLAKLVPGEVEAVLAHELGHFRLRHVAKRIAMVFGLSFVLFAGVGWIASHAWFFTGLGVAPSLGGSNDAPTLILLVLVAPVFSFFVVPFVTRLSRRHEFEADAYACRHADGRALASALLKLHEDNASTLTPDPLFARFYYSHPPAAERIAALGTAPAAAPTTSFGAAA